MIKALAERRLELTWGQLVAILGTIIVTGGGSLWVISGQWATVNLRLNQTEEAVAELTEKVGKHGEDLASINATLGNIQTALGRWERKFDNLPARYGSALPR